MRKNILKMAANITWGLNQKVKYNIGLPVSYLRPNDSRNTEIVSLSIEQTQQLLGLNTYNQSINHLQKNNLTQSLSYLQLALSQAKTSFPYSVNLQTCLLNRMSILQKLLNKNQQFEASLEEIYLQTLSAKGPKHLSTVKSLINYLICLIVYNPSKADKVLAYLSSNGSLPDYLTFFSAVVQINQQKQYQKGLFQLSKLPEDKPDEKIFKFNNIGFMMMQIIKFQHHNPANYQKQLKSQAPAILKQFLTALIVAQNHSQSLSQYNDDQIKETEQLISQIQGYLANRTSMLPTTPSSLKSTFKHHNSHIIAMNIATLLFEIDRQKQSFFFLKNTLDQAFLKNEIERVGMALVLLGRIYFNEQNPKWEETYLQILQHCNTYPPSITKETLASYSRLLFQKGRIYEAQGYLNQSFSIQCHQGLQGLILPSYDFSF